MPSKVFNQKKTSWDPSGGSTQVITYIRRITSNWVLKNGKPDLSVHNAHDAYIGASAISVGGVSYCFQQLYIGGISDSPLWRPIDNSSWGVQADRITQVALAKYLGRMRKGQASLGVTFGSWRQSVDMIKKRLLTVLDWIKRMTRMALTRKRKRESLAGIHLENIFGWQPLISDISSALAILGSDTPKIVNVVGRHQGKLEYHRPLTSGGEGVSRIREDYTASVKATVAASLEIVNPNTYLLARLGLLNPLQVVWDLIPWSFLVGMFVNINSLLASLSDYVGTVIRGQSTTLTVRWSAERYREMTITGRGGKGWALARDRCSHKYRSSSIPAQAFQFRVPTFNVSTLAMLGSLVVQKLTKLDKILSLKTS